MTPIKRTQCPGKPDHQQCKTCARKTDPAKPGLLPVPEFVGQLCPMRVCK